MVITLSGYFEDRMGRMDGNNQRSCEVRNSYPKKVSFLPLPITN